MRIPSSGKFKTAKPMVKERATPSHRAMLRRQDWLLGGAFRAMTMAMTKGEATTAARRATTAK
jgi:hypothetical protein